MKLYFAPGACSVGLHAIMNEIGKPFDLVFVNTKEADNLKPAYLAINPKGKVPALLRDNGKLLTEFPTIAMYLAKSAPEAKLLPADAGDEAEVLELMDYICGTVHPMGYTREFRVGRFAKDKDDEARVIAQATEAREGYLQVLEGAFKGPFYMGEQFTVADAALFFLEMWTVKRTSTPLPPKLAAHYQAMLARPSVKKALETEATY
ncbi:glutathione S-transferase [Rhodovarius crocodyli]|uniref:Glutathione S-transferase n=1 Tax=Rhodovarius crocodyli TaxID=1979269 RepID=A0A437MGX4_9PROT|nr:glutathione binding-like protein [Rhodovarius crocodyli]RVT96887.1 glutathione S-transferase [Rhodovarius crocodyli]